MSLKGVRCVRGLISMQEHERCMLEEVGPPCLIPPTILQLMTRPKPEREGIKFSPSSLGNCHRRTVLGKRHDWYLDVKQGYKMVRGSIIHEGLSREPAPPGTLGVVRELQMAVPINVDGEEHTFHGTFDELTLLYITEGRLIKTEGTGQPQPHLENVLHVKLVDYKSKSDVPHSLVEPDREHVYQINSYAWMVQRFLPEWLNYLDHPQDDWPTEYKEHLFLGDGVDLPNIDEVIVDELSIVYLDMSKTRTFTSKTFLYTEGKQLGDYIDGKWQRRYPIEHEQLELEPIQHFSNSFIESRIKKGIREQLESEVVLAAPLVGDRAELMCRSCPVIAKCVEVGKAEGHDVSLQERYCNECD